MAKKGRPKSKDLKVVKGRVWDLCSEYVRRSHADDNGNCTCVTCGVIKPWQEMQAGHYVGGRGNAVLFNEEVIYPQCYHCNIYKKGAYDRYTIFMVKKHGLKKAEELLNLKHQGKVMKWDVAYLEKLEEDYQMRIKELEIDN